MSATIIDVAKLCGYSKATVSRAYAEPESVSEKARQKIYDAARVLNYTPNAIARAMVRQRTDNIAFIVHEKQYPVVMNPFYSPIIEAVLQEGIKNGYSLFVSTDHDVRLPNGDVYMKKHMDGVIIAGQTDNQTILSFRKQGIAVVILNNLVDLENLICITADHFHGAVAAVEHLISRGHRKIGLLAGRFSPHIYAARYNGYLSVLRAHGIHEDLNFVQDVEPTVEAAEQRMASVLKMKDCPTAFFCTNDTIAIGAAKAVLRAGLRIPQDMALVGFDDSDISRIIEPELTTVRIDTQLMGHLAAQKLIDLIEQRPVMEHLIETPTQLIIRGTS